MSSPGWTFTPTFHREPYPALSPSRPELSQVGRTVLIAGGSEGIGLSIAEAFLSAAAAKVIILGRRPAALDAAVASLTNATTQGRIEAAVCDISDAQAIEKLWARFQSTGTAVHVLVLNAAAVPAHLPILELGTNVVWRDFELNVRAQLDLTERFYKQAGDGPALPKSLVHVSSFAIHDWSAASAQPAYGLTKNAGALLLQQIAKDTPVEKMQIVNFNPGPNFTQAAKTHGYTESDFAWNSVHLPGQFAVWAASPEAAFLHGRFVWAEWDVDELKTGEIRKRIDNDSSYLKIGVKGL